MAETILILKLGDSSGQPERHDAVKICAAWGITLDDIDLGRTLGFSGIYREIDGDVEDTEFALRVAERLGFKTNLPPGESYYDYPTETLHAELYRAGLFLEGIARERGITPLARWMDPNDAEYIAPLPDDEDEQHGET